jgi:WD40 repeat protein
VTCLRGNRTVIHHLETGEQKEIKIKQPLDCAASQHNFAVTTYEDGLHLLSTHGALVYIVPDSTEARSVAFHPHKTNCIAIGYHDGTVRMWNVSTQVYVSFFRQHTRQITRIRFAPDCRLFLSSNDKTPSIVTLDDQFRCVSSVKLKGHTDGITDTLFLTDLNQCVTCSYDRTIKVWDCETGVCLRTLTAHTDAVTSLALYLNGLCFASGSYDETVIIWSCETFEVFRRIRFSSFVQSLICGERDTCYVEVHGHGVISFNYLTGKLAPVIITRTISSCGLSLGKSSFKYSTKHSTHSHS